MTRQVARVERPIVEAPAPTSHTRLVGRTTHPWGWWGWALGAAVAVSLTRNLLLLTLVVAAVVWVVLARRTAAPWARSVGAYFTLALMVIGVRMFFQLTVGGLREGTVLFTLPEVQLPAWAAGISLGGPVTLEAVLFTISDAGRLAAMLICVGAANALANPRRALRAVPPALYELSVAVVIALSVAPQLIESGVRVRRARRLRGGASRGWRAVTAVVIPVFEDAIDRSLLLAAGMESRGYGRTHDQRRVGRGTSVMLMGALMCVTLGTFILLGVPGSGRRGALALGGGVVATVVGLRRSGRRLAVTRYRPDPWGWPEAVVLGCGATAIAIAGWLAHTQPNAMLPPISPAAWPTLHPAMIVLALVVAIPAVATPLPPRDER
ncbi:MAG TPA: CbiQ family ECF transporter T component [Propionibacteriaceae bacterium]|nr:CbiQ family ECF transporter T component [Propionibacteriaceae bacterium]